MSESVCRDLSISLQYHRETRSDDAITLCTSQKVVRFPSWQSKGAVLEDVYLVPLRERGEQRT